MTKTFQIRSLDAVPADLVLAATPIDLTRVLSLNKPVVRVRYDLEETDPAAFAEILRPVIERGRAVRAPDVATRPAA